MHPSRPYYRDDPPWHEHTQKRREEAQHFPQRREAQPFPQQRREAQHFPVQRHEEANDFPQRREAQQFQTPQLQTPLHYHLLSEDAGEYDQDYM